MKTLTDYLNNEAIQRLAIPSNYRLGKEIADKDGVEMIALNVGYAKAKVSLTGLQNRTVELISTNEGLQWTCTCSKKGNFCKHCVAVGLAVIK